MVTCASILINYAKQPGTTYIVISTVQLSLLGQGMVLLLTMI